jgi:acyl CoA:acetate/3-ketoacid CoA transferase
VFPRAEKIQAITMNNKRNGFGPEAPLGIMASVLRTMASDSPSILIEMLGTAPVVAALYGHF